MHFTQQLNENDQDNSQVINPNVGGNHQMTPSIQAKQHPVQRQRKSPIQTKQSPIQRKHKPPIQAKQRPIQRQTESTTSQSQSNEAQVKHNVSVLKGQDVTQAKVHYNSSEPAKINAAAYAQGMEVHLAPGQEKHLGHELTHVAQQMGGQVTANRQANNGLVNINDDPKLEQEADQIGAKASQGTTLQAKMPQSAAQEQPTTPVVQRYMVYDAKNQHRDVSEEDYNIIHTHTPEDEKEAYQDESAYNRQMTSFNELYKKQESKGRLKEGTKRKKEGWRHPQRKQLFVSDDGRMAVEHQHTLETARGEGAEGSVYKNISSQAWADESLINEANRKLKANKAYVTLKTEASDLIVGDIPRSGAPNPSKSRFKKIKPVRTRGGVEEDMTRDEHMDRVSYGYYNSNREDENLQSLKTQDCGKANLLLMGSIQEDLERGIYPRIYSTLEGNIDLGVGDAHLTIKSLIQQIMKQEFPDETKYNDVHKAYADYEKIAKRERKENQARRKAGNEEERSIDSAYGLNAYARPDLGQGVVTAAASYSSERSGYNYHYATNIMQSNNSGDYMALEGIAPPTNDDGSNQITTTWYFTMYGTRADQSFHERLDDRDVVQYPNVSAVVDRRR